MPELSLVAEVAGEIVGYILFTRAVIRQEVREHETLVLAPVVVAPDFQRKGIGGGSLKKQPLGFKSVLLLGAPNLSSVWLPVGRNVRDCDRLRIASR
ncbi:MAG TPA: hypothetical protein DEP01_03660 [Aminobacterium sp.]|nr:hypothetical protein [Aminobacterium sp.]